MTRHPSVPDHIGWIHLGNVTTGTALIAIVAPEVAAVLGDTWTGRYLHDDGTQRDTPLPDVGEYEEVELGDQSGVLVHVFADGMWIVEGRMADEDDHASLSEIRIRLWSCDCTCHDGEDPAEHLCQGDCHDADPA
jgi:hypothetical protein